MNECPGCGGPLEDDETFCPTCGMSIEPAPLPAAEPAPAPEAPDGEAAPEEAPAVSAPADEAGTRCPECGTLNPVGAQFCIQCRHSFSERATFFGMSWLVVPAVLGMILIVVAVAAFSFGFVGGEDVNKTPAGSAAQSGAAGAAQAALNQTRNVTPRNTTVAVTVANTTNATVNVTPTRTVDPNATPWNAQEGAGIFHEDGGTHYVGDSTEIQMLQQPKTPLGVGDGSGRATGPLAWVGMGNWSPGLVSLPAGDVQVVLMSKGTAAFILVDQRDNQVGFAAFQPPGGTTTVTVPQAGQYVIAFGTGNRTDNWSASVVLPGSSGQGSAPPVSSPETKVFSYAGTGGGMAGMLELTPGTVHVQLNADLMTMAYFKDNYGNALATVVAGPNPGGATVAITKAGTYRLDTWGTAAWTAQVTWTGPSTGTIPTVLPPTTVVWTPMPNNTTSAPLASPTPTTPSQLKFSGTGPATTSPFHLDALLARFQYTHGGSGLFAIRLFTKDGAFVELIDTETGPSAGVQVVSIETAGDYAVRIEADSNAAWTVTVS